jgi:hypothetical protein
VRGTAINESLVVVQGDSPIAELHAMDSLFPIIEKRRGGEAGVRNVRFIAGDDLWKAAEKGEWPLELLKAAISRSDSPQGDAIIDGRTQDIVGLGLLPKLAKNPRGWILEHRDGLKSTLLVLDGVVADYNFALRARNGEIVSAQIFRAPPPAEHHFSRLCAVLEKFFTTGLPSWKVERNLLIAELLDRFNAPASQ